MFKPKLMIAIRVLQVLEREGKRTPKRVIHERLSVSMSTVEQVLQPMKRYGLLDSDMTMWGGYQLSKPMNEITMKEFYDAVYGDRFHDILDEMFLNMTLDKVIKL